MARSRLNTGFIIKLASAFALAGAGAFGVYKLRKPHNPAQFIAAADDAFKKGDYLNAAANYEPALELLPARGDLHLRLGQCYYQLELLRGGVDYARSAKDQFTRAAELDPKNPDAWVGLLKINDVMLSQAERTTHNREGEANMASQISSMRDAANHFLQLKPDSVKAQMAGPILTLRLWILNFTIPETPEELKLPPEKRPTADQRAATAMSDLTKLMADHPEEDQIPYWLARAKIFQAQQALRSEHPESAPGLFAEAGTMFDQSIAAKPDEVMLYLQKAAILSQLRRLDNEPGNDYEKRFHDTLKQAQAMVDPDKNPEYYENAKAQWADELAMTNPTESQDIYNKLIERYPEHLLLRLRLASCLMFVHRDDDALAALAVIPSLAGPPVTDLARRMDWDHQAAQAKLIRAKILVQKLQRTPAGAAHDQLVQEIKEALDASKKDFDGTWGYLQQVGCLQLAEGENRNAIDTLTKAADKMRAEGGYSYELIRDEAIAYSAGGQTSRAISILQSALLDPVINNNVEIHLTLAKMSLQNHDFVLAKRYIDWLAARLPDEPQVIYLQIADLGPTADWKTQVQPLYDKLPEKTPSDLDVKGKIALQRKNNDEAIRLLTIQNQADSGNVDVGVKLAGLLKDTGRDADGRKVIEILIAKNPNNPTLPPLLEVFDNVDASTLTKDRLIAIEKIPDPLLREKTFARFYDSQEQPDDGLVHWLKALELAPNDKTVLSIVFMRYVDQRRFSDAQAMMQKLIDLDVDDAHGLIFKTRLALAMNDAPGALTSSKQLTHDEPNFSPSWELYGEALEASGQLELAAEQFNQALSLQATNVEARNHLIAVCVREGKITEARDNLNNACRQFPGDPSYRDMRQRFEVQYGDPMSVLPELAEQIKSRPKEINGYQTDISALLACSRLRSNVGDATGAKTYQQQAVDRLKQAIAQWPDVLGFSSTLAQIDAENGDLDGSAKVIQDLSDRPRWKDTPKPMVLLGQIYLQAGKLDQAEKCLRQAIAAQPNSVEALLTLADVYQRENKLIDAESVLQPGLSNFAVRQKYVMLLMSDRKFEAAENNVVEALKEQPKNVGLVNLHLEVLYTEGKWDEGIKAANDAINSDHTNVYACYWRAQFLMSGPDTNLDLAQKDLVRFVDAVPGEARGHIRLAQVLDAKHDRDGAIQELGLAMKMSPQDRSIRLYLVSDYLSSTPPRTIDAEHLLTSSLAIPVFAHDPEFQVQLALLQAQQGKNDQAVATIRQALKDAGTRNEMQLLGPYFKVLLDTKNYDLLLTESSKYVSDSAPFFVYSARGIAKAKLNDVSGAMAEFTTALNRTSVDQGRNQAVEVVQAMSACDKLGPAKALELVMPRVQNSTSWRLIAIDLLCGTGDFAGAAKQADIAMDSIDKLSQADQLYLLQRASDLYLTSTPPQVDKALALYRKRLAIQPNDVLAMNNIANILLDMTNPPRAQEALAESQKAYDFCIQRGLSEPRIFDTYAWALIQSGKVDDGISVLYKIIDQQDFPDSRYHLGMAYLLKKNGGNALEALEEAKKSIDRFKASHSEYDQTLPAKIDAAEVQANQLIQAKKPVNP
jgi:tetratricopeptide (TPR) repeat protein